MTARSAVRMLILVAALVTGLVGTLPAHASQSVAAIGAGIERATAMQPGNSCVYDVRLQSCGTVRAASYIYDYAQALRDFADAPGTAMIQGTYRRGAANLCVDPEYGRLLVTDPQGAFWTAFGNLSPAKIESIVLRGAG